MRSRCSGQYWQQQVDYVMDIRLDDGRQRIDGKETITSINNSPDELRYLWLQLDQNMRDLDSDSHMIREGFMEDRMSFSDVAKLEPDFDGGFKIQAVKDAGGKALPHTINQTMMRVDLPKPLAPGGKFTFQVTGGTTSTTASPSADAAVTNTLRPTTTTSTRLPSSSPASAPTTTAWAGRTSSSSAAASSPSSSGTTTSRSPFPATTSWPPRASCRTPRRLTATAHPPRGGQTADKPVSSSRGGGPGK